MSLFWFSEKLKKKVLDEVGKQLNLEISKDGKVDFKPLKPSKPLKQCQFCQAMIPKEDVVCPSCKRALI